MTDDATRAFDAHDGFVPVDGGYESTTATFDAVVSAVDGDGEAAGAGRPSSTRRYRIRQELPTLDAAVVGETVAPVVEDGWYETFERRLEDVGGVTRGATVETVDVTRDDDRVTVDLVFDADPADAAGDATALLNYVEGTWFEGVVPGYEYREDVRAVREMARNQGGAPP